LKRLVVAGGGTGGHTSAGLAVVGALREHGVTDIHWIGSREGVEARRAPEAGVAYHAIPAGKLRRSWDWRNASDLGLRVPAGLLRSLVLLRRLRPDLVLTTGGFVAFPPGLAAWILRIPLVVHEQTSVPGLTNRILGRLATRIAVTFPPPAGAFPSGRVVLTGNPVRPELLGGSRAEALRLFGLDATLPLVYVTGGALGAQRINRVVGDALPDLLPHCQVLHQCGENPATGDGAWLAERAGRLPLALRRRYALRPHLGPELAHVYAATDLLVGRSGAGTVNECCRLGLPALFIPLPGARGDEQMANARRVEAEGGAAVLPQPELSPRSLHEAVQGLLADRPRLERMRERAGRLAVPDAAERIARLILEVAAPTGRTGAGSPRSGGEPGSAPCRRPPAARGTR
jgi:UDP-N-acetylglucosamine--N-acetylmuramyl-(pentapeptide) pyrophosphoryl-undecaprenol N-acetylglucosamine transferase